MAQMAGLEDREVVVLLLGLIVGGFAFAYRKKLAALPLVHLPILAASFLLLGWTLSTLETWFAPQLLNFLEHSAYLAHSGLMLSWVFTLWSRNKRTTRAAPK